MRTLLSPKGARAEIPDKAALYPTVELTYWSPPSGVNFGDYLSKIVVELILASRGLTLGDEANRPRQLLAIGSILHYAKTGAVVWGSGVNGKIAAERHTFADLDVRAVRGPLTRNFLADRGISVPEVYGDPALLLPLLAKGRFEATGDLGPAFVPNLNDVSRLAESKPIGMPVILPTDSWDRCVTAILRHSLVLASSLHGIVVAEAYGIPARYVRLTEREHLFKYTDYYAGTGRKDFTYARSIREGLEMGGALPPSFDHSKLISAFPFDLWRTIENS